MRRRIVQCSMAAAALAMLATPLVAPGLAQVRTVDPNETIDSDLRSPSTPTMAQPSGPPRAQASAAPRYPDSPVPAETDPQVSSSASSGARYDSPGESPQGSPPSQSPPPPASAQGGFDTREQAEAAASRGGDTFTPGELLSAAEGTFGKGAAGLSGILERTLKEQGQPNAYIAGSEASAAVVLGLRYGKGTMFHKVEGQRPVYWTGPSVGFDLGGDAAKVFVLVYNLYDSEELYHRFPAAEGRVYFVGGFAATYMRWGKVVLIPIRLGVGWRQGVNLGYMKFGHKQNWFPL
ncbi:hypothetical protein AWL63_03615 [Sphingomonas panacis]|uniref:DUF1134 domain-containing protein n=1 Tax=Sphingomonas panacis TaxID=1560345 RepID=A0A1B3Z6Z2_9SPHN|nr:DUF1134 domain-containing protein [Sphingomonas panacis]AOH83199.1 hypothetical protein AWL63_03615 [Sphingomonas panacis]